MGLPFVDLTCLVDMYRCVRLSGNWPYVERTGSASDVSIAMIFKLDCARSAFSGEVWLSGIFSHWELILLYFLRVARLMTGVATAKRLSLNFLRIVSRRTAYCSWACASEGRSAGSHVLGISSCCGIRM